MKRSRAFPTVITLVGIMLGVTTFLFALGSDSPATAQSALPPRAVVPLLASDGLPGTGGPATTPTSPTSTQSFTIHFLDVGQGDAILVTVNGHRILIDGGPSKDRLRTRLQSLGVTDIDAILVTNPDADHIRGLIEALAMFQVETAYASASTNTTQVFAELQAAIAVEPGIQSVTLLRGGTIPLGGLQLNVLHPATITGDRNEDSLALRLSCGTVDVLFMGDATTSSESSMLAAGLIPDVEVVKAGHHGSNTSSGQPFVMTARPEHVVFSAGLDSQYGHPHGEVVARYQAAGAQVIRTDITTGDDTQLMSSNCATYSFTMVGSGGTAATATPTKTNTPSSGTATATKTNTPQPTAVPTVTSGFSVPACYVAGVNSCNCSDFSTHSQAQWFHDTYDPSDVNKLDGSDQDGLVCESLPG